MDRMLQHYENECTFHTVECLRCGEGVQHRNLPTHYLAGCTARVSAAITESSQPTALTLEDVNAALEDLKAALGDANHDRLLPVIQSQLNELTEQVGSQETRFAGMTRQIGECERQLKGEMARIAANISPTVSDQLTSPQYPAEKASTSSRLSWRSEKALILRKLEHFTNRSLNALESLWQTSPQDESRCVIAHSTPMQASIQHLFSALATTLTRITQIGRVVYLLTLENCDEIIQWQGGRKKFAQISVLHMRDTYFTLAVWKHCNGLNSYLDMEIVSYGMLEDSRCLPPIWHVTVEDGVGEKNSSLISCLMPCYCRRDENSLVHFHLAFGLDIQSLTIGDFLRDGKMKFCICLSDQEMNGGIAGAPNVRGQ
ncbi:uncharacterized protein [Dermacentor albipictus]|uniref:uncharacterized protein n=1 Tax=Dermacentor albipictus TaxID=60249 RepID=UPI0038FBEE1E